MRSAAAPADWMRVNTLDSLRTGSEMAANRTYKLSNASASSGWSDSCTPNSRFSPFITRYDPASRAPATAATPSTSMIGSDIASMFTTSIALL